jgi:hypothetical protein
MLYKIGITNVHGAKQTKTRIDRPASGGLFFHTIDSEKFSYKLLGKTMLRNFFCGKLGIFPTLFGGKFSAEFSVENNYDKCNADLSSLHEIKSRSYIWPQKNLLWHRRAVSQNTIA